MAPGGASGFDPLGFVRSNKTQETRCAFEKDPRIETWLVQMLDAVEAGEEISRPQMVTAILEGCRVEGFQPPKGISVSNLNRVLADAEIVARIRARHAGPRGK